MLDDDDLDDFDWFENTEDVALYAHFIWSTAGQQPWLSREWIFKLGDVLNDVMVANDGAVLCVGGGDEHIHVLASLPATISIDEAVKILKLSSARWIRQHIPGREDFAWQQEYFVESISPRSVEQMSAAIHNQWLYHKRYTYREEILAFMEERKIPFDDEKDLWI